MLGTHGKIPLDRPQVRGAPVFVKTIGHVAVPGRGEQGKIGGVPVSFDKNNVVGVDLADCLGQLDVKVPQHLGAITVGQYRLVEQVVAADLRLVFITLRNLLPDQDGQRLIELGFGPQARLTVTIADVAAVLPARGAVHVEDQVKLIAPAPFQQRIDHRKSLFPEGAGAGIVQRAIMEGQADRIAAPAGDRFDIALRHVIGFIGGIKLGGILGADQVFDHVADGGG